jgi:Activator of Hsp90 ATPase homolog 1-like protein
VNSGLGKQLLLLFVSVRIHPTTCPMHTVWLRTTILDLLSKLRTMSNDLSTAIILNATTDEVFSAVSNPRGWWQGVITGPTAAIGDEFVYEMTPYHVSTQQVIESVPGKKVAWLVTQSSINFVANKNEWLNTVINFEIEQVGENTKLTLTHQGLVATLECYGGCSSGWEDLMQKSLTGFITMGEGVTVFK